MPCTKDLARAGARSISFQAKMLTTLPLLAAACGLALILGGCVALPAGPAPDQAAATVALTAAADAAPPPTALAAEPAAAATETPPAAPAAAPASTGEVTPPLSPAEPTAEPATPAEPLSAQLLATVADPAPSIIFTLSPDGALLAYSTYKDNRYQGSVIMDAAAGVELRRIGAEASSARHISFSADGQQLVALHGDGALRIWDVATGVEAARIADVGSDGQAALSPDGGQALVSRSFVLQIWDVATGALVREIPTGQVYPGGGWAPDGKSVFALRPRLEEREVSVAFWDAATGDLLSTIPERAAEPGRGRSVQIAAVSSDGGRVIVAGPYVTRIMDRQTGRELFHLAGWDAALAAGADRLATRDYFNQVRVWDSRTGELLAELGPARSFGCNCIAISADGRRIAARDVTDDESSAIKIWEVRGQAAARPVVPAAAVRRTLKLAEPPASAGVHNPYPPAISQDGRTAVWNTGGEVIAWDLATGQRTYSGQIVPRPADSDALSDQPGAAFADPSAALLVANPADAADNAARIWRVGAAEPQWTFPAGEKSPVYSDFMRGAAWTWSGDGSRVALDSEQRVAIWEPAAGSVLRVQLPKSSVVRLALSTAGERVVVALRDGRLLAYDVAGGAQLWEAALPSHAFRELGALSFSPDDRRLVAAAEDLTLRVLDAATGAELAQAIGLSLAPSQIAWRGDSRYFVTGGDDLTAIIWDAETAQPVRLLPGHDEAVSGVAFTADGQQVVTLTTAFTVQYWDVSDLK